GRRRQRGLDHLVLQVGRQGQDRVRQAEGPDREVKLTHPTAGSRRRITHDTKATRSPPATPVSHPPVRMGPRRPVRRVISLLDWQGAFRWYSRSFAASAGPYERPWSSASRPPWWRTSCTPWTIRSARPSPPGRRS